MIRAAAHLLLYMMACRLLMGKAHTHTHFTARERSINRDCDARKRGDGKGSCRGADLVQVEPLDQPWVPHGVAHLHRVGRTDHDGP